MINFILLVCAFAGIYQVVALIACLRHLRRREPAAAFTPPISVLKPVRGLDPGFYEAIRSHATQDYDEFELLFGVSDPGDAAIPEIRRLQAEFPRIRIELIHCPDAAPNPKVAKLTELVKHARFPVLLVNDSDIRVEGQYLRSIVQPLVDPLVGLVTCLYRVHAVDLPGKFEALGVATDFAPSTLVAPLAGVKEFGLGATLLFRAEDLKRIGGYGALAGYVADDYQLAKRLCGLGLRVHLSKTVVETSSDEATWRGAWRHQVRWQRMIRVSRWGGYIGLPITFATLWSLVAALSGAPVLAAAILLTRLAMALTSGVAVLRCPITARFWPLIPIRDLWGAGVWLGGLCGNTILWRGAFLRLKRDGRIASNPPGAATESAVSPSPR